MIQNKYSLDPLSEYLKTHPNAKNKELYDICNATTNSQKTGVRRKKGTLLKRRNNDTKPPEIIDSLTSENLEKIIVNSINGDNSIKESKIRLAVDYFIKVKGKTEEIEDNIDMEALREIGITSTSRS